MRTAIVKHRMFLAAALLLACGALYQGAFAQQEAGALAEVAVPLPVELPDLTKIDTDQFLPPAVDMPSCGGVIWYAVRNRLPRNKIGKDFVSSGMNYFGVKKVKDPIEEKQNQLKVMRGNLQLFINHREYLPEEVLLKQDELDSVLKEFQAPALSNSGSALSDREQKQYEDKVQTLNKELASLEADLADKEGYQKSLKRRNKQITRTMKRIEELKAMPQVQYADLSVTGSQTVGGIAGVQWLPNPGWQLSDIEENDRLFKDAPALYVGDRGIRATKGSYNVRFIRGPYMVSLWMLKHEEMDLRACGDTIARLIDSRLQAGVDVMLLDAMLVQSIEGAKFIGNRDTAVRVVLDLVAPKPEMSATVTVKVDGRTAATATAMVKQYKNYSKADKKLLADSVNLVIPGGLLPTGWHKVTVEVSAKDEPKDNLENNSYTFPRSRTIWHRPHGLRVLFLRTHDTISMQALDALATKAGEHLENVYPVSRVQVVTDPRLVSTRVDFMSSKLNETANMLDRYNLENPEAQADFAVGVAPEGKYADPGGAQKSMPGIDRAVLVSNYQGVSHEIGHSLNLWHEHGIHEDGNKSIGKWIKDKIAFDRHNQPTLITEDGTVAREQGLFGIGDSYLRAGYSFMGDAGAHPKIFHTWVDQRTFDFLYTLMKFNRRNYFKPWAVAGVSSVAAVTPPASEAMPWAGSGASLASFGDRAAFVVSLASARTRTVIETGGEETLFKDATQTVVLPAGQAVEVQKGIIKLSLPGGAHASAPAGTVFEIMSPTEVSLKKGAMAVKGGLTIHTPAGKLMPEGTFFAARVAMDGTTHVDVIAGMVRAETSQGVYLVNEGQTAALSPSGELIAMTALQEAAFLAALALRQATPEKGPEVLDETPPDDTTKPEPDEPSGLYNGADLPDDGGAVEPVGEPVLYLDFTKEPEGDVVRDLSGNGLDAKIHGAKYKGSQGMYFDGNDDYLEVAPSALLHSDRAITIVGEAMAMGFGNKQWHNVFWRGNEPDCTRNCENREYSLFINYGNYLHFSSTSSVRVGRGESMAQSPRGSVRGMVRFAASVDTARGEITLYMDGAEAARRPYSKTGIRLTTGPLTIGGVPASKGNPFFKGYIRSLRIYPKALTEEQIRTLDDITAKDLQEEPAPLDLSTPSFGVVVGPWADISYISESEYFLKKDLEKLEPEIVIESGYFAPPGTNGPTEIVFAHDGSEGTIEGLATVLDCLDYCGRNGSVDFIVMVDGREAWRSGLLMHREPGRSFSVPLTGVEELRLITTDGGNGNGEDWAAWLNLTVKKELTSPALVYGAGEGKESVTPIAKVRMTSYTLSAEGRRPGPYDRSTEKIFIEAAFDNQGHPAFFTIRVRDSAQDSYVFEIPIYTEGLGKSTSYELSRPILGWPPGFYEATVHDDTGTAVFWHKFEITE